MKTKVAHQIDITLGKGVHVLLYKTLCGRSVLKVQTAYHYRPDLVTCKLCKQCLKRKGKQ